MKQYRLIVTRYDLPINDVILRNFDEHGDYETVTEEKEIETDDIYEFIEMLFHERRDFIDIKYEEVGE